MPKPPFYVISDLLTGVEHGCWPMVKHKRTFVYILLRHLQLVHWLSHTTQTLVRRQLTVKRPWKRPAAWWMKHTHYILAISILRIS